MSQTLVNKPQAYSSASPRVLFVDADGSLFATDIFFESFLLTIVRHPYVMLLAPFWLLRGKAYLKRRIARLVTCEVEHLPYRADVIEFLREESAAGRRLVLATAGDELHARRIAEHVGVFDDVLASDGQTNLKGAAKRQAICEFCRKNQFDSYGYVGDAFADLAVWEDAGEIYVVQPSRQLLRAVKRLQQPARIFQKNSSWIRAAIEAIRPHNWVKNILIFVPLVAGQQLTDASKLASSCLAFFAFCACASCVYLVNDLVDLPADRLHPRKKGRPFASGRLPIAHGPPLAAALLAIGFALSLLLPSGFGLLLLLYIGLNFAYSFSLKRKIVIDVVLLAVMYSLRIIGGGQASSIVISEWLLAFSLFFFTSLAFAKRYSELVGLSMNGDNKGLKGRGYQITDIRMLESIGPASGLISVLVVVLYINSDTVKELYSSPFYLWLICPLLLYWTCRLWFLAGRRMLVDDPLLFALTDLRSLVLFVASTALLWLAAVA